MKLEEEQGELRHLKNILIDPNRYDPDRFVSILNVKEHNWTVTEANDSRIWTLKEKNILLESLIFKNEGRLK